MRELVLLSHLQLVNETLALEANEKLIPKKKQKEPSPAEIQRANREIAEFKRHVYTMRSSPLEYARNTGYHDLFDLEPPGKREEKDPETVIRRGMEAARRTLRSMFGAEE
jgi:hypothetical protein